MDFAAKALEMLEKEKLCDVKEFGFVTSAQSRDIMPVIRRRVIIERRCELTHTQYHYIMRQQN
jgi:hypothetical protein